MKYEGKNMQGWVRKLYFIGNERYKAVFPIENKILPNNEKEL